MEEEQMGTRTVLIFVLVIFVLMPISLVPLNSGFAQDTKGRWAFGLHGGANMWVDDYNKRVIGDGGEIMVRYGITRAFSAGLLTGYEELKSNQDPPLDGVTYLKLQAIPISFVGWIHFNPNRTFNPYLYFGAGAMLYKRQNGDKINLTEGQFKTSIHVPVGVGFEAYASKNVSIAVDFGYRVLDDYTDGRKSGKIGGYAIAKAGVNFYFGTSASEKDALERAKAQREKELAEAEAQRMKALADAEAQRAKALADAEARRIKDSTDAEARRLAELNAHRPKDTVIVLERGKTVILRGINFEFGKATLMEGSETTLRLAFNALVASPDVSVLIVGHTDNVGSATYNKKLSLRRAQTVKSWLVGKGIAMKRLTVAGKGFDEPIDDNSTDEGRANNRRMEFRVLK
jgi:outer membrane protein OmpA-like peptidoglycan-associated protein